MAKLFQSKPGMVQVIDLGEGGAPGVLSVSGPAGRLSKQEGVVITGIGVNQDVNAQFMASLQKVIYVYSFGDRMGAVQVNGLCFDRLCEGGDQLGYLGAWNLMNYYDDSRAVEEDRLMKIVIGFYSLQGYLIAMNLNTASSEFKTMSFNLRIVTVPKQVGFAS